MVDLVIILFAIVGFILIVAIGSLCHNHFKLCSMLSGWYQKTHPEVSKTASGHLIRVVQGSVLDDYKLAKTILGKGASGVCRRGIHMKSKKIYAIKTIELKDESVTAFYKREIDILKDLEHLNIIRVFEAYEQVGSLGLVMVSGIYYCWVLMFFHALLVVYVTYIFMCVMHAFIYLSLMAGTVQRRSSGRGDRRHA